MGALSEIVVADENEAEAIAESTPFPLNPKSKIENPGSVLTQCCRPSHRRQARVTRSTAPSDGLPWAGACRYQRQQTGTAVAVGSVDLTTLKNNLCLPTCNHRPARVRCVASYPRVIPQAVLSD